MSTSIRASSSNHSTTGTAMSVAAPTGTTAGDVVVVVIHGNNQTTTADNNVATIVATNLTSGGNTTAGTSQATASITPTANQLILATLTTRTGITADPTQPTATGCGLTWVVVNSVVYDNTSSSRKRVTTFRAMGASPTTGAITFDEAGQTQTGWSWVVDTFTGMDTTGTNGSGAIVQSVTAFDGSGTTNTVTATLAAFGSTSNATYGALAAGHQVTSTFTAGTGFSITGSETTSTDANAATEFRSTNSTNVGFTFGSNSEVGVIGIEIKAQNSPFTKDLNDYQPCPVDGHVIAVYSRRILAGDPSTYNFTLGTSGRWAIVATTFQNPNAVSIYDIAPLTANATFIDSPSNSTSPVTASITTSTANAIHMVCAGSDDGVGSITAVPAGYASQGIPSDEPLGVATKTIASASATGTTTFTTGTSAGYITLSFAVKDIGGVVVVNPRKALLGVGI